MHTNRVAFLQAGGAESSAQLFDSLLCLPVGVVSARIEGIDVDGLIRVTSWLVEIPRDQVLRWDINVLLGQKDHDTVHTVPRGIGRIARLQGRGTDAVGAAARQRGLV